MDHERNKISFRWQCRKGLNTKKIRVNGQKHAETLSRILTNYQNYLLLQNFLRRHQN